MKSRIFTTKFWKTIFCFKEPLPNGSEKPPASKYLLQKQPPVPTEQLSEAEHPQKDEFPEQERARAVREEKPTKNQVGKKNENLIVRSELNLEQNSIFTVSTCHKKSREVMLIETAPTGGIMKRKAIIGKTAGGIETGILTTHHFKVYLALLELWEKANRPIYEPVHFTILKIIKQLKLADSGKNYHDIKRQLLDLRQIPLTFIDSFFEQNKGTFSSLRPFNILNYLDIYERTYERAKDEQKTRGYGEFRFDDHILASLVNNYTHPLRLDVIKEFKKHKDLAILLYAYLDRCLAFKDKYEIGLERLFEHLDLSQDYIPYPAKRKHRIEPVLDEIRGKELSTGILSYAQIHKTADGKDYKLVCRKKPFVKRLKEQEAPFQPQLALPAETGSESPEVELELPETESEPKDKLLNLLIEKGLTQKQAAKLVAEKSPEVISNQLEYLPFRIEEYKAQRKEINEAAILYDSINNNWSVPKGYLEAEKEKEREAGRIEQERIARLEQEKRDREEQEKTEIEAYKATLTPEERTKLRERAMEEIRSMKGIKEEFVTELLIGYQENKILREEMENDEDL